MLPAPVVPWELFEEHLAESAFLFGQRRWALGTHDHALTDIRDGEELRLAAHVDALVLGGKPVADKLLVKALASEDPGELIAAALTLLWSEHGPRGAEVIDALRAAPPAARGPLVEGFELAGRRDLVDLVWPLLGHEDPGLVAPVLRALARLGAPLASVQRPLLGHADAGVAAAALESVELWQSREDLDWVAYHLARPDGATRDAALRAGLALGSADTLRAARHVVASADPRMGDALLVMGLSGGVDDVNVLAAVAEKLPAVRRGALIALGHSGRVAAADVCAQLLDDDRDGAIAGEAFSAITGLVLRGEYVQEKEEAPEPPPLEAEDLDAPVVETPEDRLPRPDAEAVRGWWRLNRLRFLADRRFLRGEPMNAARLIEEIAVGPVRRSAALSLELLVRSRGTLRVPRWGWAGARLRTLPSVAGVSFETDVPFERFLA